MKNKTEWFQPTKKTILSGALAGKGFATNKKMNVTGADHLKKSDNDNNVGLRKKMNFKEWLECQKEFA